MSRFILKKILAWAVSRRGRAPGFLVAAGLVFLAASRPDHAYPAAPLQPTKPMNIITIDGKEYLAAAELEDQAGIALKALPGQNAWVACIEDRCALVTDSMERDGQPLVAVAALADALGAEAIFEGNRTGVRLRFNRRNTAVETGDARLGVGQLAPNFRLPLLDGTFISLAELRGKRVLINSWASW